MIENRERYTYKQAAVRVKRHPQTIRKWRKRGMIMGWDEQGRRVVEHKALLQWWRESSIRDSNNRRKTGDTPNETYRLTL